MQWEKDVGQISHSPLSGKRFEWVISDFFSFPQTYGSRIISPEFKYENQTCCLGLWPCEKDILGLDWIGLNLWISPNHYPTTMDINIRLGILSHCGSEYKSCSVNCQDEYAEKRLFSYEKPSFLTKSEFIRESNMIAPYGKITVFCEICTKEGATSKTYSFQDPEIWAA